MNDKSPHNILVTGAANRIGAAIARTLAVAGHNVVIHYHCSQTSARDLVSDIADKGGAAALVQADLQKRPERSQLVASAAECFGPLSVLINNASIFEPDSAMTLDEKLWDSHFALHAEAPMFLARDFTAQLPKKTGGNIINIIDESVLRTNPAFFSYNLSKTVLWTATKTLAQSLAPAVRVNAIGPGPTLPSARQSEEDFARSVAALPLEVSPDPAEIAKAVLFLLDTPSITGQMIALDGGEHLDWRGRGGITPALK
ncbi:MAG TPA: SDR family oxidoreductase [Devosia sp.]|nr:SDR family oxidoreductase [Devosia sp.]